jgi:hypothetical protein
MVVVAGTIIERAALLPIMPIVDAKTRTDDKRAVASSLFIACYLAIDH